MPWVAGDRVRANRVVVGLGERRVAVKVARGYTYSADAEALHVHVDRGFRAVSSKLMGHKKTQYVQSCAVLLRECSLLQRNLGSSDDNA